MTQKDMPMAKRLDMAKSLGFNADIDPWLVGDLSYEHVIPEEVLKKVRGLDWPKGVEATQNCWGLCFVAFLLRPLEKGERVPSLDEVREWATRELEKIGVLWVERPGRSGAVYCGRIRMPEWGSPFPTPTVVAFRWLEYPGRETTLHMVDGVGRIVGGVSGREHPADGIPKWCAWLNPSRHIGYYVGKEQAKAAVELAAREER